MNKKGLISFLLLLGAILTVTACSVTRGSGDLITETWSVSGFDSISLSGTGEVIVTQGGGESLSIETDDNVMKHIKAEVDNGTLTLGFKNGVNLISPSRLVFYVGIDDLTGLDISGSGGIESDRIETDRLEAKVSGSGELQISDLTAGTVSVEISGSGNIDLSGEATSQDAEISGAGKYLGGNLCSGSVKVSVSGSGNATVCATETLDADTSGSGDINYYGRPSLNTSSSGSGKINSLGEN